MYKVALITARKKDPDHIIQNLSIDMTSISLEAYLSAKTKDVEILVTDDVDDLVVFCPDIVGISSVTENYNIAIDIAKRVKKECGSISVVGGSHITLCPESFSDHFELGVVGEGEETLLEIVDLFKSGRAGKKEYSNINGIIFRNEKKIIRTRARRQITNLDLIPAPNRKKWIDKIGMPYVMTSRGCPYNCYFCSACRLWKGVRYFSVDRVISEIRDIFENFAPRSVRFFDDIFTLDKKRVKEITSKLIKTGLSKKMTYTCWSRANLIDKKSAKLLKDANFAYVSIGVESASEKLMKKLKGKTIDPEIAQNAIDILYQNGLDVVCSFIIGTPGEKTEDLDETYSFIEKNSEKITEIELNYMMPYPGAPLWEYAEKRGLVGIDMNWNRLTDTGLFLNFDLENYIYLNEEIPWNIFAEYVEKFKILYQQINMRQKNAELLERTLDISTLPAKLGTFHPLVTR